MLTPTQIQANRKLLNENDRQLADAFKALGNVTRFRMFRLLTHQPEITVGAMAKILRISTPLASLYINDLEQAKLIRKNRAGKSIVSGLDRRNPQTIALTKCIQRLIKTRPKHNS